MRCGRAAVFDPSLSPLPLVAPVLLPMAKLGEGDGRWIVKERDDGKNCNNWHWSETNLTQWSKEQLTEGLVGIVAMEEGSAKGWCKITALDKMSGDVTVQSRKQKKFPLYELEIKLKWEGQLWDDSGKVVTEAKGHIKIPDLSEETYDDLEMTVICDDETAAMKPLKEAMRTTGCKGVREACMRFVKQLKVRAAWRSRTRRPALGLGEMDRRLRVATERRLAAPIPAPVVDASSHRRPPAAAAGRRPLLWHATPPRCHAATPPRPPRRHVATPPRRHAATPLRPAHPLRALHLALRSQESINTGADKQNAKKAAPAQRSNNQYVVSSQEGGALSSIKIKYNFSVPPPVMYDTLLDTNRIRGATASDASMSKDVGGKLMMFSGSVEGENVRLTPFDAASGKATIVWKWRFNTWQPVCAASAGGPLSCHYPAARSESARSSRPVSPPISTRPGFLGSRTLSPAHSRTASHMAVHFALRPPRLLAPPSLVPPPLRRSRVHHAVISYITLRRQGHHSTVTIDLVDKEGATELVLEQTGVPEDEKERTEKGWTGLLLDRLKAMLGGSVIR